MTSTVQSKTFRFAVAGISGGWLSLARRAEDLGYSAVLRADHLDLAAVRGDGFAALPALAAAAMVTTRVKLGTLVLNQDLRNPAVLAAEAATVHELSGHRLELGIGAGWAEHEYHQAGIPFDDARTRVDRLDEYLRVVRGLLHEDRVDLDGRFFRISGMPGRGAGAAPGPAIVVGGGGTRVLTIAARRADIVNLSFGPRRPPTEAVFDDAIQVVHRAAGDRLGDIEVSTGIDPIVTAGGDSAEAVQQHLVRAGRPGVRVDSWSANPMALVGTVPQLVDALRRHRSRWGISYYVVPAPAMADFAPVVAELTGR
jgi:probable F420-dependent oxidoreductase